MTPAMATAATPTTTETRLPTMTRLENVPAQLIRAEPVGAILVGKAGRFKARAEIVLDGIVGRDVAGPKGRKRAPRR